jgi:predicted O-methyltransferase YrrM
MKALLKTKSRHAMKHILLTGHKACLRLGIAVLPNHFYSSVPDLHELAATRSWWARKSSLAGLSVNLDEQVLNLRDICLPYQSEYAANQHYLYAVKQKYGLGFGYIEAQALHAVVRHYKPDKILEVGSGISTYCMLQAAKLNDAARPSCEVTCVEPYPSNWLQQAPVQLMNKEIQKVPLELFLQLKPNDLLFIDSSHTVKTGSDVLFLVLEVLPRLAPGVIVHIHDIFLPFDYSPNKMQSIFDWQETALIHAFLIGNSKFRIVFCLSHLHEERPGHLMHVFPNYRPLGLSDGLYPSPYQTPSDSGQHFPSSLFLQVQG